MNKKKKENTGFQEQRRIWGGGGTSLKMVK